MVSLGSLDGALNKEKALVGALSVIVKPMDRMYAALVKCKSLHGSKSLNSAQFINHGQAAAAAAPGTAALTEAQKIRQLQL